MMAMVTFNKLLCYNDLGLLIITTPKTLLQVYRNPVLIIGSIYNPLMATVAKMGQQQLMGLWLCYCALQYKQ